MSTKIITLTSPDDIQRVDHYLGDATHINHAHYGIERGVDDLLPLLSDIVHAQALLNRERGPQHQIKIIAYWVIWRLPDFAKINEFEREHCSLAFRKLFGRSRSAWHNNTLLETSDFNAIIPAFNLEGFPELQVWKDRSLFQVCKDLFDQLILELNIIRLATGTPKIEETPEDRFQSLLARSWKTKERKVAMFAVETNTPVNLTTLPWILRCLAQEEEDKWEWELENGVYVRFRPTSGRRKKWVRIALPSFLELVSLEQKQLRGDLPRAVQPQQNRTEIPQKKGPVTKPASYAPKQDQSSYDTLSL